MIELLYYHGIFDSLLESIDIYGICLGFSMFAMIWLLISSFYTIVFQFFINKWNEHELLFNRKYFFFLKKKCKFGFFNRTRYFAQSVY